MEPSEKPLPKKLKRKNKATGKQEFKYEGDTLWQDEDGNVIFS